MPLPPAPSKKADRVDASALSTQAMAPSTPKAASSKRRKAPSVPEPMASAPEVALPVEAPVPDTLSQMAADVSAPPSKTATRSRKTSPRKADAVAVAETPQTPTTPKRASRRGADEKPRLFVLDTNVLMHDPISLFRFEEHDVYLPMVVLEELDNNKKGMTEVARNARQASRTLDALAALQGSALSSGLPLNALGNRECTGHLYFQTELLSNQLPSSLPQGKADNQILGVLQAVTEKFTDREVILVSKDINMRIKSRALGLKAEDYENDKALEDGELLYSGALPLPVDFWDKQTKSMESWQQGGSTFYKVGGPLVDQMAINQFVYFEAAGEPSLYAKVVELRGKFAVLRTLKDYGHLKNAVWGVTSRNREQNFVLNLLMDPEVDFVTITGTAGTGKTLMALAAGLTQVLDERRYTEIIMTRATVSVGEDIGFLPGTEEEKMGPWMGALDDNLEFLAKGDAGGAGEWGRAATNELIKSRIKIKSLNFMRGRTFMNRYVIIDEAQNLTPKQMKTLITRAGPGTKIICMGNLAQIDTPYLTEGSSGLTYAVDRFKGWPHGGHITLARGERSRLADFASEVL